MKRAASALLLLLAGLALLPQVASAAARVVAHGSASYVAPALTGDRIAATRFPGGQATELWSFAAGTPAVRLGRVRDRTVFGRFGYGGGSGRLAALRVANGTATFLAGAATGPLSPLAGCGPASGETSPIAAAADGALSAWAFAGCDPHRVLVDDNGTRRELDAGGYLLGVAVAGRRIAWIAGDSSGPALAWKLTVWNADSGIADYSVALPPPGGFDLQSDGTVALTTGGPALQDPAAAACSGGGKESIVVYTVASPAPRRVPLRTCEPVVNIAADRIAYLRDLPGDRRELAIADLAGSASAPVARFAGLDMPSGFDFDGSRIAWGQTRCRDYALLVRDASDTSTPQPGVTCPLTVSRDVVLHRDGTLRVRIACAHGCRSGGRPNGFGIVAPHWLHVRGRVKGTTQYTPFAPFDITPGGHATLRIKLSARQVRTLRRHRRARIRLKAVGQHVYLPRIMRTARAG